MKAARLTDGHSCPIPPAPYLGGAAAHVGGPIIAPGAPLVLSEGLAASPTSPPALVLAMSTAWPPGRRWY